MPTDGADPFDVGLLSPVTAGHDAVVSDAAVLDALVTAEVALTRAWHAAGLAPEGVAEAVSDALGWRGAGRPCAGHGVDAGAVAAAAVAGGNPVIPLVGMLRARIDPGARDWIHRGATSQDILDSALVLVARSAIDRIDRDLEAALVALAALSREHRTTVAAARTLTQQAVPTTWGARTAGWARGLARARHRLSAVAAELPAQLGGAAGTMAAVVQRVGAADASALPRRFALELGLAAPGADSTDAPWHTARWPVTELGDALVQIDDALGKIAADVANASRTEVAEVSEASGGGSSAMPQKQNPVEAVLIRSAAIRAPQLAATLHLASALAVDERPDGAWHAEWPTLRELLRLTLGAGAHAASLLAGLTVDTSATARNLGLTGGLLVSERLAIVLVPLIGRERFDALIAELAAGGEAAALLAALPEASGVDVDDLLDPARYTGLAERYADAGGAGGAGAATHAGSRPGPDSAAQLS